MSLDYKDAAIDILAGSEAELREANRQLVDLVADLAYENAVLRFVCQQELVSRIHGDGTIARLQRKIHGSHQ